MKLALRSKSVGLNNRKILRRKFQGSGGPRGPAFSLLGLTNTFDAYLCPRASWWSPGSKALHRLALCAGNLCAACLRIDGLVVMMLYVIDIDLMSPSVDGGPLLCVACLRSH